MPQAALPDLNTAWIMDKREFLQAIKQRNYTAVVGSLFSINAALPEDYQVRISDIEYEKKVQEDIYLICPNCKKTCPHCDTGKGECLGEFKRIEVPIKQVIVNHAVTTITGSTLEKVWECKRCHNIQLLSKTKMVQTKIAEPHFFQIVPSPPIRSGSLTDRNLYYMKMQKWAYQFYNEIAHSMSRFRLEYKPKTDDGLENVLDGGEEQENLELV